MENSGNQPYPVQFDVDYPEGGRNRLTTLIRPIMAIPIEAVNLFVNGSLVVAPFLLILFRAKYPRWWFDWNLEMRRFTARINAYWSLLRDEYPSTDEEQAVHLDIKYPDVQGELNRFLPLVKWLLALPHYIILVPLLAVSVIFTALAWLTILVLGTYPKAMFSFVVGVSRWAYRVGAYAFLLTTDRYPPFSLKA